MKSKRACGSSTSLTPTPPPSSGRQWTLPSWSSANAAVQRRPVRHHRQPATLRVRSAGGATAADARRRRCPGAETIPSDRCKDEATFRKAVDPSTISRNTSSATGPRKSLSPAIKAGGITTRKTTPAAPRRAARPRAATRPPCEPVTEKGLNPGAATTPRSRRRWLPGADGALHQGRMPVGARIPTGEGFTNTLAEKKRD